MKAFTLFVATLMILSCHQRESRMAPLEDRQHKPVRYGMITGIKPDKIEYYKQLHAKPWPQVLEKIGTCNIRNYSIYLQKIDDRFFLFSYFDYVGNNFDADMEKMAADSVTQRWWRETDPCQLPLAEAMKKHKVWTEMTEVFHVD